MNKKCYKCLYDCKGDGNLKLKICRIEKLRSKKNVFRSSIFSISGW